jgi:hypothetical protein
MNLNRLFDNPRSPNSTESFEQMMRARRVKAGIKQKVVVVKPTCTGKLANPVRVGI